MLKMNRGKLYKWESDTGSVIGHEIESELGMPVLEWLLVDGHAYLHTLVQNYHTYDLFLVPTHALTPWSYNDDQSVKTSPCAAHEAEGEKDRAGDLEVATRPPVDAQEGRASGLL
jgi:hypothetical protein